MLFSIPGRIVIRNTVLADPPLQKPYLLFSFFPLHVQEPFPQPLAALQFFCQVED